jgi:hypothetical protein
MMTVVLAVWKSIEMPSRTFWVPKDFRRSTTRTMGVWVGAWSRRRAVAGDADGMGGEELIGLLVLCRPLTLKR